VNPVWNAIKNGARRGWTEFLYSVKSPQDQGFFLFTTAVMLGYLFLNRNNEVTFGDAVVMYPTLALPSLMGALIAFGMVIGVAYGLAMERENGTLLRSKAAPYGVVGHATGQVVASVMSLVPSIGLLAIPGILLFGDAFTPGGWGKALWVIALGTLATLPIGMVIGATVPGVQKVGTWGMLPFFAIVSISGIFTPMQALAPIFRGIAQVFPVYWIGLGMRSAFLPSSFAAFEIGESWRTLETVAVLGIWAVVGLSLAPPLFRRMARRQSGSAVQQAREKMMQWVR